MNETIIVAIIAALPGLAGSIYAYRNSERAATRASQMEAMKVEAGAYERARKLYEDGIRQLEDQLERLNRMLADEQAVSTILRQQINNLEETVYILRQQLVNAGVALAPSKAQVREANAREVEGWHQP